MTTEHHDRQPVADLNRALTPDDAPVYSIPGDITEIEYENALEATRAERAWQAQEAKWEADTDWQAFRGLCYSDTETPDAAALRKGVNHLIAAAQRGHAPAQCRLATELHLGEGQLGIKPDVRNAIGWYRLAAKQGEPTAQQSLMILKATHPEMMREENDVY